jgi:hypothetical protein
MHFTDISRLAARCSPHPARGVGSAWIDEPPPAGTCDSRRAPAGGARASALIGISLLAIGLWSAAVSLRIPVGSYDEGLLLVNARLIGRGLVPHRDFYTQYPPGIYLLIAAIWWLGGISPLAVRLSSSAAHLIVALLAGRLVGRAIGRRMSLLTAGLTLCWLTPLDPVAYAWTAALATALVSFELVLRSGDGGGVWAEVACGLAFVAVSCFRHDLFTYLCATGAVAALALGRRPRLLPFVLGGAVPALAVWGPLVARAGWRVVLQDLVIDQERFVRPARDLPLPTPWTACGSLAECFGDPLLGAVVLGLAAPVLGLVVLAGARRLGLVDRRPVVLLTALAVAVLPQMLGRTDVPHAVFGVTPAVGLTALVAEALAARWRWGGALSLGAAAILLAPLVPSLGDALHAVPRVPSGPPPFYGMPADVDRRRVVAFVRAGTAADEPIFVGNVQHQRMIFNEVDLYFFADRPGATRYMQFDPGIETRAEVQRAMIHDLDERRTRLLVLVACCWHEEPNESRFPGSDELDRYIRDRYLVVARFGRYWVLWRRDALGDLPADVSPGTTRE